MQKNLFQETQDAFSAAQLTANEAYLTKIQLEASQLRAQAMVNTVAAVKSGIVKLFAGTVKWMKARNERNRVLDQLYSMSDRNLADIGLTRGDIYAVVNGTMIREPLEPVPANISFIKKPAAKSAASTTEEDTRIAA